MAGKAIGIAECNCVERTGRGIEIYKCLKISVKQGFHLAGRILAFFVRGGVFRSCFREIKFVAKKAGDISILKAAIQQIHKCEAVHQKTVYVDEKFEGKSIWSGDVEVFGLIGHPKAMTCFAWLHEGVQGVRPVALLERWPVNSPRTAVQTAIALGISSQSSGGNQTGAATG